MNGTGNIARIPKIGNIVSYLGDYYEVVKETEISKDIPYSNLYIPYTIRSLKEPNHHSFFMVMWPDNIHNIYTYQGDPARGIWREILKDHHPRTVPNSVRMIMGI